MMYRISGRVNDGLERIYQNNPIGAFNDICGAIEGTIKKSGLSGKIEYKSWVAEQLNLIFAVCFPGLKVLGNVRIAYSHPELRMTNDTDLPSIQELVYHIVRCGLYHSGTLPDNIEFTDDCFRGASNDSKLGIPRDFVLGLILAVVCAKENSSEWIERKPVLVFNGIPLSVNMFWGKTQALIDALAYTRLAAGLPPYGLHDWRLE